MNNHTIKLQVAQLHITCPCYDTHMHFGYERKRNQQIVVKEIIVMRTDIMLVESELNKLLSKVEISESDISTHARDSAFTSLRVLLYPVIWASNEPKLATGWNLALPGRGNEEKLL